MHSMALGKTTKSRDLDMQFFDASHPSQSTPALVSHLHLLLMLCAKCSDDSNFDRSLVK